jgi:hypothetical protein
VIARAAEAQDDKRGDGTISIELLTNELLKQASRLNWRDIYRTLFWFIVLENSRREKELSFMSQL